ncbi:MAG: ThiF family adenylyltransferase [Elusimicrobia bacterium]|nr:ThiF family adenylyltransferase [Elusimicrobiota bacterium]
MKPVIREHVMLLDVSPTTAKFFCSHRSLILSYDIDEAGGRAITLANGRRTLDEILVELKASHITHEDISAFFAGLSEDKIFRNATSDCEPKFEPHYETRLQRQLTYLSGLAPAGKTGRDLQDSLRRSTVLIVGAGGGGSHLAVQSAGVGVGRLIVLDHDRVERANLGRQIYYADQIGSMKVHALQHFLNSLAPETEVIAYPYMLQEGAMWLDELIPQADLVINCADYPSMDMTTLWLFKACYRHRVPLIAAGGYNGHMSSLPPTILPGRSTCWPCFDKFRRSKSGAGSFEHKLSELPAGIFLPATTAMAALQMPDIVRVLTGYEPPRFLNCRAEFDVSTCSLTIEPVSPDPNCDYCTGRA